MNLSDEIRKQIEKNKGLKLAVGEINNHLSILENLVRKDIMEQVDDAYQRGLEDGKQTAVGAAELREKLEYQKGFEDGKAIHEKGCEGCEFESMTNTDAPCRYCSNNFKNLWRSKKPIDDKIEVGDEVAFHHDDGRPDTVVVVTYIGQDGFIDGMDGRGTQYAHKNPIKWTKTGRHFDIASILEDMRND